jgi:hypothetical protein
VDVTLSASKKLKAIREELAAALAANGRDPIHALDDLIKASHSRTGKPAGREVLQSLRRFMEGSAKSRRPRRSSRTKIAG